MKTLFLLLAVAAGVNGLAQKGTVAGTITDKSPNNVPLPFANILIKNTPTGVNSDENGTYSLSLDAGTYIIQFSFIGYETIERPISITAGETLTLNIALGAAAVTLKGVEIQSVRNREKETALLIEQKKAAEIRQSIGAQELSRKGISSVEEGLTKITGITKVGSRGLFVRGLEDRYNNLLVNDLAVPSNNPFRKIIPLDLFPTDIVGVIDVFKTFNPNIYGDFAGGTFNIATAKGSKSVTKVNIGAGFTIDNNLSDFKIAKDADGAKGFFGLTANDRMLPAIFGNSPTNRTLSGQQSLRAFKSGFDVSDKKSPLNTSIGLLHSEKFNFGNNEKFSYLLSLNFDNSYKVRKGADRTVINAGENGGIEFANDFEKSQYEYETNASALIGTNYKTDRLDLALNLFYLRTTVSSIEDQFGVSDNDEQNPNYFLRTNQLDQSDYLTAQISSKYFFGGGKSQSIRGGASFSKTSYQQPDRKFFGGTKLGDEILTSYGGNNFLRQYLDFDGSYYFSGMAEYALEFGDDAERKNRLIAGYNANASASGSSYRFVSTTSGGTFLSPANDIDRQIAMDLENGSFNFRESSNAQYKVKLRENTNAAYVNLLWHFGPKWQMSGGLRAEHAVRETNYRENGSFTDPFLKTGKDKFYILPSVNLKYAVDDNANLRLAAGITYTKPVTIEALPITYINADGTSMQGNPFLENSDNYNLDLKYELFPTNKEMIAIGVFTKKINNAIERAFSASAGGFQTTYFNTGDAVLYGAELEFILDFGRLDKTLSDLSFGFNTSLMQTRIDTSPTRTNSNGLVIGSVETHGSRELQGASKWLINSDLKYQFGFGDNWRNTISAVYSVFGKRIYSVGSTPYDHIYELPVSRLDLVWSSKVSEHFDLKLSADNILNPKSKLEIGGNNNAIYLERSRVLQDSRRGVGFSAGLSFTF